MRYRHRVLLWSAAAAAQLAANGSSKNVVFIADKTSKIPYKVTYEQDSIAEFMLCYCALYRYKSHTLIQFPPTEDFYSLENFKMSSDLRF